MLGTIAAKTERIGLATGVTCPTVRYHPAIIAQAAATLALVSDGRFTLGVGAGERLNEHVVGPGFPETVPGRHERLREALEIIRLLWRGGYRSYVGKHLTLADARVSDLPDELPPIAVAASGKASAELGDGLFATEPKAHVVSHYTAAGGDGPRYAEVPMAWAEDPHTAASGAGHVAVGADRVEGDERAAEPGELRSASATVREVDVLGKFACGSDVDRYVEVAQPFADAGFDHLVMQNAGPDPDGFLEFFQRELGKRIRSLTPG
ncbi:flavin-dependent oxidoreductase, F420-dependent methylene-tetrahydromethanopterin reductase [Amycolatopsis methanolica 239]|uniref:Flavin-dependent oxidoreductase, F420-dependent methylene-tetrahydromethanopterin reductase n=1 Tax=Amycolatopsis methanolica 239 TaxID=1068978 RepID=A0A076MQN2_AMYME|nr:flavin-dependent oxidoreductase, F420-dependent methylene-tetrahydromethanopterin reductase [Amycolatopsis methanolica 239]